jgi:hypothetical protein
MQLTMLQNVGHELIDDLNSFSSNFLLLWNLKFQNRLSKKLATEHYPETTESNSHLHNLLF